VLKDRVRKLEHMLKDASNEAKVLKLNVSTHTDKNREVQTRLLQTQDGLIAELETKVEELEVEKAKGGQQEGARKQPRNGPSYRGRRPSYQERRPSHQGRRPSHRGSYMLEQGTRITRTAAIQQWMPWWTLR